MSRLWFVTRNCSSKIPHWLSRGIMRQTQLSYHARDIPRKNTTRKFRFLKLIIFFFNVIEFFCLSQIAKYVDRVSISCARESCWKFKWNVIAEDRRIAHEISPPECSNFGINRTGCSPYIYISSQVAHLRGIPKMTLRAFTVHLATLWDLDE